MRAPLPPLFRFLLWDYDRGSLAYDLLILGMALVIFLVPESAWNDPLRLVR